MTNGSLENETSDHLIVKWEPKSGFIVAGCILAAYLSVLCHQTIIDYFKSKPIGNQTSVDTLNVALFRNLQLQSLMNIVVTVLMHCTEGTGVTIAAIVAWPADNLSDLFILILAAISILHQVIILFPHMIEKDLNLAFKLLGVVLVSFCVIPDIFSYKIGHMPTLYYELRKVPNYKFDSFNLNRFLKIVLMFFAIPIISILRLRIYYLYRGQGESDSKVISDKSLVVLLVIMFCTAVAVQAGIAERTFSRDVVAYSILNVWPIFMMVFCQPLRKFVLRKYTMEQRLDRCKKHAIAQVLQILNCYKRNNVVDVENN